MAEINKTPIPRVVIAVVVIGWTFLGAALLVTLTSRPTHYTIVVNHETWTVKDGIAERVIFEGTTSYSPSPSQSLIEFPYQSTNRSLIINITIGPGLVDHLAGSPDYTNQGRQ